MGLVRLADRIVSRWCAAARVRLNRHGAPRPRSPVSKPPQGPQQLFITIPRLIRNRKNNREMRAYFCSLRLNIKGSAQTSL